MPPLSSDDVAVTRLEDLRTDALRVMQSDPSGRTVLEAFLYGLRLPRNLTIIPMISTHPTVGYFDRLTTFPNIPLFQARIRGYNHLNSPIAPTTPSSLDANDIDVVNNTDAWIAGLVQAAERRRAQRRDHGPSVDAQTTGPSRVEHPAHESRRDVIAARQRMYEYERQATLQGPISAEIHGLRLLSIVAALDQATE